MAQTQEIIRVKNPTSALPWVTLFNLAAKDDLQATFTALVAGQILVSVSKSLSFFLITILPSSIYNSYKYVLCILLNETNKVKKEHYLMRQNNTIYKFSIKLSFSSIGQDKS